MTGIDWGGLSEAEVLAFADTVAFVANELARGVPAPRGAPLFGLDMSLADPELLDQFSRHGIFRKYQRAIALGGGLGGVSRWWTVHYGCSVATVDPHAGLTEAAARLSVHSGLAGRTTFRAAPWHNLPYPAESFTHAWSVDGLAAVGEPAPVLRETQRVLRPSGLLAFTVPGATAADASVARWVTALIGARFIGVVVRPLPPPQPGLTIIHAAYALRSALHAAFAGEQRTRLLALADQLEAARTDPVRRVFVVAEKPS